MHVLLSELVYISTITPTKLIVIISRVVSVASFHGILTRMHQSATTMVQTILIMS